MNKYSSKNNHKRHEALISWIALNLGWVNLNTNGFSKGNPIIAFCGGLIRSDNGRWICGFSFSIGTCLPFKAKLWGSISSLEVA